jgi:ABC-2 type transport system ATP-binding protein
MNTRFDMPAIEVRELRKTFTTKRKAAGLAGSLRSLVRPDMQAVEALRCISFEMESGELLGLIGPNGAGKSTTIKILTGFLYPSSGAARVLGFVPWEQRRPLAYQIGTVFGQRPQLWYHLPALDTFYLFGKIYDLSDHTVRRQRARDLVHRHSRRPYRGSAGRVHSPFRVDDARPVARCGARPAGAGNDGVPPGAAPL